MVRRFIIFAMVALISFFSQSSELSFEEGKHYFVMPNAVERPNTVTKLFSYRCPHCAKWEKHVHKLNLPEGYVWKREQFSLMTNKEKSHEMLFANIVANLEDNPLQDSFIKGVFHRVHDLRQGINNAVLKKMLFDLGLSQEDVVKLTSTKSNFDTLSEKHKNWGVTGLLTGVPTFIVNEKYVINTKALAGRGIDPFTEMSSLFEYLSKKGS